MNIKLIPINDLSGGGGGLDSRGFHSLLAEFLALNELSYSSDAKKTN